MLLRRLRLLSGPFAALSLVLVSATASAQEMTEEDRLARCANNRARLDELNAQILKSQPLGPTQIKQANDDLVEIGVLAGKPIFMFTDYGHFADIAYRYSYNPKPCMTKSLKECGVELGELIHKQITDSEEREAALSGLKAEAQRHETNLIALRCTAGVIDVLGDWDSTWGDVHVTSDANGFTATYDLATGGRISGSFDGHKVDGIWAHTWSQRECAQAKLGTKYWGRVVLTFSDDGKSFSGNWSYCDDPPTEGTWNGTRK